MSLILTDWVDGPAAEERHGIIARIIYRLSGYNMVFEIRKLPWYSSSNYINSINKWYKRQWCCEIKVFFKYGHFGHTLCIGYIWSKKVSFSHWRVWYYSDVTWTLWLKSAVLDSLLNSLFKLAPYETSNHKWLGKSPNKMACSVDVVPYHNIIMVRTIIAHHGPTGSLVLRYI